jgi:hypothetical protein
MHANEQAQVEAVAAAILEHLQAHPLAADSVQGVARWWLGPRLATVSLTQVEQALELLVAREAMRRLSLMDGTLLYSMALPQQH